MQIWEIQLRNDTAANWTSANPTLAAGEPGVENDTGKFKIGNGTQAWTSLAYSTATAGGLFLNGSRGSPNAVSATVGITLLSVQRELQFIKGSGGAVVVTATPPIEAGTSVGQELVLMGTSASNTVTLDTATGLNLNGAIVMGSALTGGGAGASLYLIWDGTTWNEVSRR